MDSIPYSTANTDIPPNSINNCLSISCNTLWNIKLFNHLPATVVMISTSVHRIVRQHPHASIQYIHIMPETVALSVNQPA